MSYEIYKVIHIAGIMLLFLTLGGLLVATSQTDKLSKSQKRPWMITHGVSLFLILLGGFGLLARLGVVNGFPIWVWIKLIIWGVFGGAIAVYLRKPNFSKMTTIFLLLVGVLAAITANYKPFL